MLPEITCDDIHALVAEIGDRFGPCSAFGLLAVGKEIARVPDKHSTLEQGQVIAIEHHVPQSEVPYGPARAALSKSVSAGVTGERGPERYLTSADEGGLRFEKRDFDGGLGKT